MSDGGPAFPMWTDDMPITGCSGMSLRDWFAGMALQGMYASRLSGQFDLYLTAHECYRAADAMLAERSKS